MTRAGYCEGQVEVRGMAFYRTQPCGYKAKKDGYCGIHHPDAVKAREERSRAAFREKWDAQRRRTHNRLRNAKTVRIIKEALGDDFTEEDLREALAARKGKEEPIKGAGND